MRAFEAEVVLRWKNPDGTLTEESVGTVMMPVDQHNGFTSREARAAIINMEVGEK